MLATLMTQISSMISIRIPCDLLERLDAWCDSQIVSPARTAVITQSIKDFLDRQDAAKKKIRK